MTTIQAIRFLTPLTRGTDYVFAVQAMLADLTMWGLALAEVEAQ